MPQINSSKRTQLQMLALEELIDEDNIVRVIDIFCSTFSAEDLGFEIKGKSHEGRPAYAADVLIKLYIYGYLNSVRSSRKLEKECKRNVELWWLLHQQQPGYKTIANFRKDNFEGFRNLFDAFRSFGLKLGLYGKSTIAIDGSKFRAQNSKKNNYNKKKIKQHLDYLEKQSEEYLKELEENDQLDESKRSDIKEKLDNIAERNAKYKSLERELENSEETQISTTDPDARALPLHMKIVEVSYNLQSVVDDKHNLIVDYEVTNKNDMNALSSMAIKGKEALGLKGDEWVTVLADKGYCTAKHISICHDNNIDTLVAPKKPSTGVKEPRFSKDKFVYNYNKDNYTCPTGHILTTNNSWYQKSTSRKRKYKFKRYTIKYSICSKCPYAQECVGSKLKYSHGRSVERGEYQQALEDNNVSAIQRKAEYKRRQAIVEHPFDSRLITAKQYEDLGSLQEREPQRGWAGKRQWGYTHTLLKGLEKVGTEFSIILLCYNLKRIINIMGVKGLKEALNFLLKPILDISAIVRRYNSKFTIMIVGSRDTPLLIWKLNYVG